MRWRLAIRTAAVQGLAAAPHQGHFAAALRKVQRFVTVARDGTLARVGTLAAEILPAGRDVYQGRFAVARQHLGVLAEPVAVGLDFLLPTAGFLLQLALVLVTSLIREKMHFIN